MPKLKTLKPRLGTAKGRLPQQQGWSRQQFDRRRDETQAWRAWYKTARWQKLRWSVLVRDLFTCRMCGRCDGVTSQLVCDHVEPHGGDEAKFWGGPFQTLCKPCHDGEKQRQEQQDRSDRRWSW